MLNLSSILISVFVLFCPIGFISVLLWCSLFYSESILTVKDENCSLSDASRNQGQFAGKSHQSYIILNILHYSSVSLIRSSMQTAINKVLKNGSYSIFYFAHALCTRKFVVRKTTSIRGGFVCPLGFFVWKEGNTMSWIRMDQQILINLQSDCNFVFMSFTAIWIHILS